MGRSSSGFRTLCATGSNQCGMDEVQSQYRPGRFQEANRVTLTFVAADASTLQAYAQKFGARLLPCLGDGHIAFTWMPGTAIQMRLVDDLFETERSKLGLLHSLCSLIQQLSRLDPDALNMNMSS